MQHIIPNRPAETGCIATVYCNIIEDWDVLAALTEFETTAGGDYGMGDSGLADITAAISEMRNYAGGTAAKEIEDMEAVVPAGSPRCRVYFKKASRQAAFRDALEGVGAVRVKDNEPNAIFIPSRVALEIAARVRN